MSSRRRDSREAIARVARVPVRGQNFILPKELRIAASGAVRNVAILSRTWICLYVKDTARLYLLPFSFTG